MRFRPKKDPQQKKPRQGLWHRCRRGVLALTAAFAIGPAGQPPAPPATTPPPAPGQTSAPLALPDPATSRMTVTRCIAASDLAASTLYPQLTPVFNLLAAQPISGAPVITRITAPAYEVNTCLSRTLPDGTMIAAYESVTRRLIVGIRHVAPATVAHEAFHAHQHVSGGFTGVGSNSLLTAGDRATGLLLIEASAAAYAMVVFKEASFTDPAYAKEMGVHNYGMTRTFNTAFDTHYAAHADKPEDTRRRLALQAGGQAVVTALMSGNSHEWKTLYRDDAAHYLAQPSYNGERTAEYAATRAGLYARIGQIAPDLQLIPAAYLSPAADATISASQRAIGLDVPPPPPANTHSKPATTTVPKRPAA